MQTEIWLFSQLTLFFHIKKRKNSVDKMLKLSVALSTLETNWNIAVNKYSKLYFEKRQEGFSWEGNGRKGILIETLGLWIVIIGESCSIALHWWAQII